MNKTIRNRQGKGWDDTHTLRVLSTSCSDWERKWQDSGTETRWLDDVYEWDSLECILSRKGKRYLKNLKDRTMRKGLIGTNGFINLDQCIEHASEDRTVNNAWKRVHNDMLWFLMIEYGPKVGPTKIFTMVANDERVSQLWPTVHAIRREDGEPEERSTRETIRQRWDSLGLWALGLAKRCNYSYSKESQMEVLRLLKRFQLPFPKSTKAYLRRKSFLLSERTLQNLVESREREIASMGSESDHH